MPSPKLPSHTGRILGALALCAGLLLPSPASAEDAGPQVDACLGCHGAMASNLTFGDGSTLSILVPKDDWTGSVHNGRLGCTDCHRDITGYPHVATRMPTAREYQISQAESCQNCHYAYYTRALDGIHYKQLSEGNQAAPTCVDCHGAHAITAPHKPRVAIQERCARCHAEVSETYTRSVHGAAISGEAAEDVPVCTDCHGAHSIQNPMEPSFHASSHNICAKCHGDAERMEKYDLNPKVVQTYLDDFHGVSNQLIAMGAGTADKPLATCTDCHGVHDIQPFDSEGEPEAVRARVAELCKNCHEGVDDSFSYAWLSHYEPSLENAPLVWAVQWGYRILIPFIMLGLVLHILLHLWRMRTHR